jgi:glucose-1-phosphate cytidylyltransferase
MDTLRDWQALQEMVERGEMPWTIHGAAKDSTNIRMVKAL